MTRLLQNLPNLVILPENLGRIRERDWGQDFAYDRDFAGVGDFREFVHRFRLLEMLVEGQGLGVFHGRAHHAMAGQSFGHFRRSARFF